MKKNKLFKVVAPIALSLLVLPSAVFADSAYTVKSGDTLWKIAAKNKVGVKELITANPSLKNPNLIYPNQKVTIPTTGQSSQVEKEVIRLTNVERQKAGLKPLVENWELSRVARIKSQDMEQNNYFDHNSPKYGSPFTMMKNFGISYKSAGENIAQGQRTPQEVVTAWMNSQGHRQNILNPNFNQIGIGHDSNGNYWTQQFIQK